MMSNGFWKKGGKVKEKGNTNKEGKNPSAIPRATNNQRSMDMTESAYYLRASLRCANPIACSSRHSPTTVLLCFFIEDPSSSMAEGPLLATYIEKLEGQVEDTFSQRTWELFLVDNMFQSLFKIMISKHPSTIWNNQHMFWRALGNMSDFRLPLRHV